MSSPISFDSFCLKKLSLKWKDGKENITSASKLDFSFDLKVSKDNENELMVSLFLNGKPDNDLEGLIIDVEICGIFTKLDKSKDEFFYFVNATTILYGILRGQLSMLSSSFPSGSIILPTVMMSEKISNFLKKANKKKKVARKS